MNNFKKAIVLDLDETLIHSYITDNERIMILRPNIGLLIEKLQEVKTKNIDIILCTTSRKIWVEKFFELKPIFRTIFNKIYTRDNEEEWRNFKEKDYPLEYKARGKNVNLEYLKPITTFGYDQVLYIDDNNLENIRLQILFELTEGKLNKDIVFFTGFKFYRKSFIWEKMLDYNNEKINNNKLKEKFEEYIKIEETNPGFSIMNLAINDFINKPFTAGLSTLDEYYYNEYKKYDEKISQLEHEIQRIIEK